MKINKNSENNAWSHMAAKAQPAKPTLAATSPMQPSDCEKNPSPPLAT